MKRNYFFALVILLLTTCISIGQSKFTETITIYSTQSIAIQQVSLTIPSGYTYQGANPSYANSTTNMGMISDNVDVQLIRQSDNKIVTQNVARKMIYRTIYEFPLYLIKYTPTNNITITNVKVNYSTTG
jgi:hypothetical protein